MQYFTWVCDKRERVEHKNYLLESQTKVFYSGNQVLNRKGIHMDAISMPVASGWKESVSNFLKPSRPSELPHSRHLGACLVVCSVSLCADSLGYWILPLSTPQP